MIVALNFIALPDTQTAGAYRYIANILEMLQFYAISGSRFIIYKQKQIPDSFFKMPSNVDVQYVDVPTLGRGIKRILFEQTIFYKYLLKCDVFYSYCTSMPLFVRTQKIFTLHDVYCFSDNHRHSLLKRIYLQWTTRLYVHCADHILTVSQFSLSEIQKYLHVPDDRISITYNFLLPSLPHKENTHVQVVKNMKPYFLFVGSLLPHKNIKGMIDGFIAFNTEHQYELRIVGQCADESLIADLQSKTDILYMGFQRDEVLNDLYKNCVSVVLLSFCEGFGIPPMEGFRYSKPALVADKASLPEVVGEAGIKVDPYDVQSIARGFQQVLDKSTELIRHIPQQLRKFDPFASCEKFMDVLGIKYQRL
ncbi:MAG: glycosyltransferase family 4 protein [Paludibacteraceae bacterium]|nr:glycosyltransferase family 4 protein [Paludibacteraceae bacterium]